MRPTGLIDNSDKRARSEITSVFKRLEDGFHQQDADIFDAHFSRDAVQVTAAGQRMTGWDAIHSYHKERLEGHAHGLHVALKVESIGFLAPTIAIVHTLQETTAGEGDVRCNSGTWTLIERAGKWWICAVQQTNVVALPSEWSAHSDSDVR
ncbi:conserved hypothetical protein [Brevibacterium sandarakinum]|uniref:DUF4440 domain-containing protein n=1 Tax=Brevibacterium sandarakinum TaxID=629680 RepID=A0A1H1RBQ4_BRESA|nr:conserved hypothetical protein [Brevibacterium sandarakinum]